MSQAFRESGIKFVDEKDRPKVARFTEVKDFGASLTSQSFGDEADINKIMARVVKGQPVLTSQGQPFYGDVSDLGGLQESIMKVQEADDLFMQFPADVRSKFDNDPVKFVGFLEDSQNYDEALKLGIVKPRPITEPVNPPVPEPGDTPHS